MVLIPALPAAARPLVFVAVTAFMNLPEVLAQISLQGFLGEVFQGQVRARAIALRNKFGNVVVLIITLSTGLIISYIPKTDAGRLIWYRIFFVFSFLTGLAEIAVFRRFEEPDAHKGRPQPSWAMVSRICRDKKFTRFLAAVIFFQFVWQTGWPLGTVYQITYLKADEVWLALFAVTSGIGSFVAASFWARLIHKRGNTEALALSALTVAFSMTLMGFSNTLPVFAAVNVMAGVAVMGINTTTLNGLIAATPDANRIVYIAVYNMAVNFSLFLSPFFSNFLMECFPIKTVIFIVAAFRAVSAGIIFFVLHSEF
jgi:predicted MFS family arabinose efflux permease